MKRTRNGVGAPFFVLGISLLAHADECVVKATGIRDAIMFMLTTNGAGPTFGGRDNMIVARIHSYD